MHDPQALVTAVVMQAANADIEELLRTYARRVNRNISDELARSLASPRQDYRVIALTRLLLNICYGADTERGALLAAAMLEFLRKQWRFLKFENHSHLEHLCVATLTACVYAHYEEGQWAACPEFIEEAAELPGASVKTEYWNAPALLAQMRIASNDIGAAQRILEEIPFKVNAQAPRVSLAHHAMNVFRGKRFELDERQPSEAQAGAIWNTAFAENIATLRDLAATLTDNSTTNVIAFGLPELQPLQRALEEMQALAGSELPFKQKSPRLALANQVWRETLFTLLNPGANRDRATAEWVSRVIDRAHCVVATSESDEQEIARSLQELSTARDWSKRCGDWHRVWMSEWARLLIFEYLSRNEECRRSALSLIASLNEQRNLNADPEARGCIANYLPGLTEKCCKLHDLIEDATLLFAACELRKDRSLVASQASLAMQESIGPQACGANTHYLSYTVLHRDNRIQAWLYTANGRLRTARLPVDVATVAKFSHRLQPALARGFGLESDRRTPAEALAALVAPLEQALTQGDIEVGDHVCIAADDPVNLIPLHSLMVAGRAAVLQVSMSRVASFADAKRLARETTLQPAHSLSIWVPTVSTTAAQRREHFADTARVLSSILPGDVIAPQAPLTAADVIGYLRSESVIHVYAHGAFKERKNPLTHSGLVVSDGRGLPALDGDSRRLLTPGHLLDRKPILDGSHVTLCACVSGLGLEGQGGDILGLEMALRLCGASSVMATHWRVLSNVASEFSSEFYRNWLTSGQSRGAAWRKTMESCIDSGSQELASELMAFSLFGGWR